MPGAAAAAAAAAAAGAPSQSAASATGSGAHPSQAAGPGSASGGGGPHGAGAVTLVSARLNELLDAIRREFELVAQDAPYSQAQAHAATRDQYEQRFSQQFAEIAAFQASLRELERAHTAMKAHYEDENMRLRQQQQQPGMPGGAHGHAPPHLGHPGPPPQPSHHEAMNGAAMGGYPSSQDPKRPRLNSHGAHGATPTKMEGGLGGPPQGSLSASSQRGGPGVAGGPPPGAASTAPQPSKSGNYPGGSGGGGSSSSAAGGSGSMPPGPGSGVAATPSAVVNAGKSKSGLATPMTGPSSAQAQAAGASVSQQQQQQQQQQQVMQRPSTSTTTPSSAFEPDAVAHWWKREGSDWVVVYNPNSASLQKSRLSIDLVHSLDHPSVACCVKFSADGKYLATGCNRMAQIFDVQSGVKVSTLVDNNASLEGDLYIRSVCFSPDGACLATGAEDHVIRVWDILKRRIRFVLQGHTQDIYSLDWSADGRAVVSGSGDRTIKVWDAETGACVMTLHNDRDPTIPHLPPPLYEAPKHSGITSVAINPIEPRCVASGCLDKMVRIWDTATGQLLERFEGHKDSVYSVSFSPDGRSLVSGSLDKSLKLGGGNGHLRPEYRVEARVTTRARHTFVGHRDFVLSLLPPDPSLASIEWIVSGSKDRTVVFWDGQSLLNPQSGGVHQLGPEGEVSDVNSATAFMLQGHKNSVISVAVSPTTGLLATGSGDCRARIWKIT
ncbi:hypothetical protein CXG81DRAFT_11506, partial [Caulochytrium protostelioides]